MSTQNIALQDPAQVFEQLQKQFAYAQNQILVYRTNYLHHRMSSNRDRMQMALNLKILSHLMVNAPLKAG